MMKESCLNTLTPYFANFYLTYQREKLELINLMYMILTTSQNVVYLMIV